MATEFPNVRIPAVAHARLQRLSNLCSRSMSELIARFAENFEATWRQRMRDDEWERYLGEDISPAAARAIRERVGGRDPFLFPPGYAPQAA
jgi:hypothetical protein